MDFVELLTLQNRCLKVIIGELDRFCHVFNTTKDATLKRNFEFLQRCYSNEILQVLSGANAVEKEYFPLLINKYLKEFNLSILDGVDGETVTRMIAEIGEGLVKVSFKTHRSLFKNPPIENILPHLKNVTTLSMEDVCDDEALKNIAKHCPYVVDLNIADSSITSEGLMEYLCQKNEQNEVPNPNLRKLNLNNTDVSDEVTELILQSFPHLEVLDAPSMPCILHKIHQKDIDQNTTSNLKKYKLKHLDVILCTHVKSSLELFKFYALLCPDVRVLTVVVHNVGQLNALSNFKKLNILNLHHDELFPNPSVNNFLNNVGTGLTVLHLNEFGLSIEVLIKSCPVLEELHMKDVLFLPVVETCTDKLKFLKGFYLEGANFIEVATSKSVRALILSAPKLQKICFCCCSYFSEELNQAIRYCCIHSNFKEVYFSHSECDYDILQFILLCCRTLKVLRVTNPKIDPDSFMPEGFEKLADIASSLRNKPKFDCDSSESDFDSNSDLPEVFNLYDELDAFNYIGGDYDDFDDDEEDSDDF
ncbi:uncharacterized protein LOC129224082 isoform X2 [Uloborus diversus]|uniref:uncharacterized protein LOC129224082 isoform X2 n=1 Tax=Uloborus diversus TaxID=327109 RepID=UPI00240948F4|nr:uncharacterized protein LOC129224082 isoform X2 [Uloborus diversus]